MLLFLMIPLTLVACTIALGPILAAMLMRDAERVPEAPRLPWDMGGATAPTPVTVPVDEVPTHVRAA